MTALAVWSWSGTPPDPRLLFSAVPLPGGAHALTWSDGSIGHATAEQWAKFRPVKAGVALAQGRGDREMLGKFSPVDVAQTVAHLEHVAFHLFPADLWPWWRLGFYGAAS